jgi:uncharacterized protein (TIGR02147 family)
VDPIFQYIDYRTYLKDWFNACKRRGVPLSYRGLGAKVGIDPGYLVHILQGSKHIAEANIPRWVEVLKLDGTEAIYFHRLVLFNRARSSREIQLHFQILCELRDLSMVEIQDRQYRYYLKWYYPAVRVALLTHPFMGDYADLAARIDPALTPEQAKEAVDLLLELGLVAATPEGVLEPASDFLTSSSRWKDRSVLEFQDQTLELARRSLRHHSPKVREVSTLTLSLPASEIATLQAMVRDFRQKVLRWTASLDTADTVMQINVAAFPLTVVPGEDEP